MCVCVGVHVRLNYEATQGTPWASQLKKACSSAVCVCVALSEWAFRETHRLASAAACCLIVCVRMSAELQSVKPVVCLFVWLTQVLDTLQTRNSVVVCLLFVYAQRIKHLSHFGSHLLTKAPFVFSLGEERLSNG